MSKKTPTILAENITAQSRIFTVQKQELEFSNGTQVSYERLLGSTDGAVLIIPLLDDDHVLLIREYGAGVGRYELGFPKGKVDPGETWKEASIRESQEEVGHLPATVRLLDSVSLAAGYMTHYTHIVLATDLTEDDAEGDEPEPLEVIKWHLSDWHALIQHPEFSEGRAYAALMLLLKERNYI
ncbi:ADP compounds hydrolase NudE [Thiomicrorhabdus lithotrophica]|uniref:ADP compounds hydrolase NudE n=1 Tax=Thiomicrorhabdus lithotrophica TaxID=2949997 RepID=A0ABY8CBT7_9GAMM|nr:ADP compounds hydrolase NudE [Thiomicrorhabdus lithotrophica]WEJ62272.1 ADP compounds hydrolase NudE [Thiomicrorhabdus lithotrophica]